MRKANKETPRSLKRKTQHKKSSPDVKADVKPEQS